MHIHVYKCTTLELLLNNTYHIFVIQNAYYVDLCVLVYAYNLHTIGRLFERCTYQLNEYKGCFFTYFELYATSDQRASYVASHASRSLFDITY